jgi:predicted AAA+ superfamily ATPase
MPKLLHRKELGYLADWAKRSSRKPLIISGARQVGKLTLVQQFAQESG